MSIGAMGNRAIEDLPDKNLIGIRALFALVYIVLVNHEPSCPKNSSVFYCPATLAPGGHAFKFWLS